MNYEDLKELSRDELLLVIQNLEKQISDLEYENSDFKYLLNGKKEKLDTSCFKKLKFKQNDIVYVLVENNYYVKGQVTGYVANLNAYLVYVFDFGYVGEYSEKEILTYSQYKKIEKDLWKQWRT